MIYLDYNATTPVLPEVMNSMTPFFLKQWGNPSAVYPFGENAANAIENARQQVANLIGADAKEILFTSGATESNQTILARTTGSILTSSVEHSSINDFIKTRDQTISIPVDTNGLIDLNYLDSELNKNKIGLVSCIWANNETGVISPIQEVSEICNKHGVLFHSDAVQAVGKIPIDVSKTPVNYLSLSAHKFFGPKGIGAIYIRKGSPFHPLVFGTQEEGKRGGTEAVPLIVGFGKAAELAKKELKQRSEIMCNMRNILEKFILETIPSAYINGDQHNRLPNTLNIGIPNVDSDMIVQLLGREGIMISNGSACKSQAITPSHVLLAMGRSYEQANEALRFSVSHLTTEQEIKELTNKIPVITSLQLD